MYHLLETLPLSITSVVSRIACSCISSIPSREAVSSVVSTPSRVNCCSVARILQHFFLLRYIWIPMDGNRLGFLLGLCVDRMLLYGLWLLSGISMSSRRIRSSSFAVSFTILCNRVSASVIS